MILATVNSPFVAALKKLQLEKEGVDFVSYENSCGQTVFRTTPKRIEDMDDSPWNVTCTNTTITKLR